MENKVYVIIVTYNAMKWVDRCFTSLRESVLPVYPVVIDNLSKDNTVSYIKEHYPEVHVIENSENRGFGQANNQGIEWAYSQGATHFFLLNQDAWVLPNTIGQLVEVQDRYHLAIVSPIHLNGKGDKMDFIFYKNAFPANQSIGLISQLLLGAIIEYFPAEGINAAAWMISCSTIETIGGFDPIFFHYGEDGNYLARLKFHNKQIAIVPNSFIFHDRIIHGNIKVYRRQEVKAILLNLYTDINRQGFCLFKSKVHIIIWFLKRAICNLLTLKLQSFWDIILGFCDFLRVRIMINESRNVNITEGAHWLRLRSRS